MMNKRTFLKTLGLGSLALGSGSIYLSGCGPSPEQKGESVSQSDPQKNWAWVRPQQEWSVDMWKEKLAQTKAAGIDAILLEVYNGRETYYEGGQLPMRENLLAEVARIAHSEDLEFHAWMWTMPCNAPEIIEQHPDWYAVSGENKPAHTDPAYVDYYKFLCPCHPEVREFVQANVRSLAAIPEVDGIHLDYVRLPDVILAEGLQPKYDIVQDREYPQYDYSYSQYCREAFQQMSGIDPLKDLEDPSANEVWRQFRYDQINKLVNNFLVPEAKKQNKLITAAVFPNWESVRQQWHTWNLDAFLPMLYHNFYNRELDFIREHTAAALGRMEQKKPIYAGLFIPEIPADQLALARKMALEGGAQGISIFSLAQLKENQWDALKQILAT
ncbi:MAG: family 10 glycosylhydrolase [Bacteroidota bacterium]